MFNFDSMNTFFDPSDEKEDCHQHCKCYEESGECCDCGEVKMHVSESFIAFPANAKLPKLEKLALLDQSEDEDVRCLSCYVPLDAETLVSNGIVHCVNCNEKFTGDGRSLMHVVDLPHDEYLGG